jgi:hypothetical protein
MSLNCLAVNDWDFSEVPNSELIGCCYWEYARESDFIRRALHRYREWYLSGAERTKDSDQLFAEMDRIQSIGDISEVIIRGCSFPQALTRQSTDPVAPNYRHPNAPYFTGSFPTPWQALCQGERASRSLTANYGKRVISPPIERGHYYEAEEIGKYCRAKAKGIFAEYHRIQQENPGKSEVQLIEDGKLKPWQEIAPSLYWESGREVTVLRINWSDYTNDSLVQHFRRWVKTHRPPQVPVPSRQGRKPGDWRAHLTRLGVMRLLGAFKPSDIFNWSSEIGRLVRESKQFCRRKWLDSTKWHDARREAREVFHVIFPFLPKDEIPRSWVRRHPANSTSFRG